MFTRLSFQSVFCGAFLFAVFAIPSAMAQVDVDFPVCMIDSALTVSGGLSGVLHPFGDDTVIYPNEFNLADFPWFSDVFDLYVSDGVSGRWDQAEWEDFISSIMNEDTTATDDDVFGIVWGYFVRDDADDNESHAGVLNPADVQIDVFDVSGRLVRTLVSDHKARGNHVVVWDGTTNRGEPTASAVYFVRMRAGRLTETQKIVLLK